MKAFIYNFEKEKTKIKNRNLNLIAHSKLLKSSN